MATHPFGKGLDTLVVPHHMERGTMIRSIRKLALPLAACALVASAWTATATSAEPKLSGLITADGSSTVGPFTSVAAEEFQRANTGVRMTVGISGTGGGFQRFCRGETDMSNASRPIRATEAADCLKNNVRYVAVTVANDGLTVVISKDNTWANCLTTAELKTIWNTGSKITNWKDVRAGFPDQPLKLFGPGTDSGTFDYFTEVINGRAKTSRTDFSATEDDNVIVQGVSGDKGAMGYFGLSYFEENKEKLKAIQVDGGKGCITPNLQTVQSNSYRPLSRPLFIYVKRSALQRAEVRAFLKYTLDNEVKISKAADFVSLTEKQLTKAKNQYRLALKKLDLKP